MRSDYALYIAAIICFIGAIAMCSCCPYSTYQAMTVILALILVGLGYWKRPKVGTGYTAGARFSVYKDARGEFRFRLIAANNEIIAVSEGYRTRTSCINGIKSVKKNAPIAKVIDLTG